ncbi:DUF2510 domain-containing protein [Microbacterium sp. NPDC076768]|uniref:DUF2510 domain-containing protein n=1 Tax=Microbacterium sp. NPDC076768 TaxID=3154858 RepID=UPI00343DE45B
MTTPAGWYDDGSGRQRWWDGQQWTEHFAPASATPAAPAEQEYSAPAVTDYPGSTPAYAMAPSDYTAPTAQAVMPPEAPKSVSVLGLVGLGLSALGTILVFIPIIGFIGFFLLAAGFVVSLISLFLKGKKWPGIAGLVLAVVGTIIGIVMSFVYLFAVTDSVSREIDEQLQSAYPTSEAIEPDADENEDVTDGATSGGRPTVEDLSVGLEAIIASGDAEGYTEEHITCFAEEFEASDLDDATLWEIANGTTAAFEDPQLALAFTEVFTEALPVCAVP